MLKAENPLPLLSLVTKGGILPVTNVIAKKTAIDLSESMWLIAYYKNLLDPLSGKIFCLISNAAFARFIRFMNLKTALVCF